MKTYRRLETPKIYAVSKEESVDDDCVLVQGDLASPTTSMQVIIQDPTGAVAQAATNMTEDETGKYSYSGYAIPADAKIGIWTWEVRATSGSNVSIGAGAFEVIEQIA